MKSKNLKSQPKQKVASIAVLLVVSIFLVSFISSKSYSDPYIIPKYYWLYFITAGMFLIFAFWNLSRKYKTSYPVNRLDIVVYLYVCYNIVRAHFTSNLPMSNDNLLVLIVSLILYVLYKNWFVANPENEKTHSFFLTVITIVCFLQATHGVFQYLNIMPRLQDLFKIGGSFGNPGPYSNMLVILIPFGLVSLLYSKKGSLTYYLGIITTLVSIIVLPMTKARSAWIAVLLSSSFIIYNRFDLGKYFGKIFKTTFRKILVISAATILAIGAILFLYKFKEQSASGRVFVWKISAQMIPHRPVFGYGFDRFAVFHNKYQEEYFAKGNYSVQEGELADNVTYAFNDYLQILIETGITGLILFLAIIYLAFINSINNNEQPDTQSPFLMASKSALIAILIASLFSYPLRNVPMNVLFFFMLSVISANKENIKTIDLNAKHRKTLSIISIILLVIFGINQFGKFKASGEWFNAYKMVRANNYTEAKIVYAGLYPTLKYNPYFLFNYGAELSLMGDYGLSIERLKEAETGMNEADVYIYMGNSYAGLNKLDEAIVCFSKASNMMPVKFYPKYRLAKIYLQKGEIDKAKELANELLSKKVKIPSDIITSIQKEMQELINNN